MSTAPFQASLPSYTGTVTLSESLHMPYATIDLSFENGLLSSSYDIPELTLYDVQYISGCTVEAGQEERSVVIRNQLTSFQFACDTELEQYEWIGALDQSSTWKLGDFYEVGAVIGSGAFGQVYRAKHRGTGVNVAVKSIPRANTTNSEELRIMKICSHPHVMNFFENLESSTHQHIVMPLMQGDLRSFRNTCDIDENTAIHVMFQILDAVAHLHERRMAHRDIKLQNIFYSFTANGVDIMLGDLGFARAQVDDRAINVDLSDCGALMGLITGDRFGSELAASLSNSSISARDALHHVWFQS